MTLVFLAHQTQSPLEKINLHSPEISEYTSTIAKVKNNTNTLDENSLKSSDIIYDNNDSSIV